MPYVLYAGKLYVETRSGLKEAFHITKPPKFSDTAAAETWLVAQDFRGNVRKAVS